MIRRALAVRGTVKASAPSIVNVELVHQLARSKLPPNNPNAVSNSRGRERKLGMPKIKTSRTKKPPEGYEDIETVLDDYAKKMRDAENESHEGKRKTESLWPIMRINHARSRYIYELYYKRDAISRELYDWLLKQGYADANLIAKWKKTGYEKLCCVRCIQSRDMNYQGSTCICRVPKAQVKAGTVVECVHCGCRGCSSDS